MRFFHFIHKLKRRHWVVSIVLVYLALAILYNITLPLFEAPDEADHYRFAQWLAFGQTYPDLLKDATIAGHEIWQTPLYYWVISPIIRLNNGGDPHVVAPLNPGFGAGYSNLVHVHTAAESFPYRGTALAVHLARLLTTLFGVGVILAAFGIAQQVWSSAALVAAALVAFNPQFLFMSAVISNDVPAACMAGLTIWWLLRGYRKPVRRMQWVLVLGLLAGMAILTKLNNVVLAFPIGLGLLVMNWPLRQFWKRILLEGGLTVAVVLMFTGWWLVLNQLRYQDWLGWQPMLTLVGALQRAQPLNWSQTLIYSTGLLTSFWLAIGYGFHGPTWVYTFFNILVLAALVGLSLWIWSQLRQRAALVLRQIGLLSVWVIAAFISLLQWMRIITGTDQGRLLFHVISGLAVLIAIGLTHLTWRRLSLAPIAIGGLLVCAVATPWMVIQPAYAQPSALPITVELPHARAIELGGEIELRGFQLTPDRLNTPSELAFDLYWMGLKPSTINYIVRVTLVDQEGRTPAIVDAMPFEGRYPTSIWRPGEILHDRVLMPVRAQMQTQLVTAYLSLYPIGKGRELVEAVEKGQALGRYIELGQVKLRGVMHNAQPQQQIQTRLGDDLELLGFDTPTTLRASVPLTLTLYWRAVHPPAVDYTVFVHLLGPDNNLVAQADGQPQKGQYPTSYWDEGESVNDSYELSLPANLPSGDYHLQVGMYRLETGERLTAKQADGVTWPDNAILLKTYHVP